MTLFIILGTAFAFFMLIILVVFLSVYMPSNAAKPLTMPIQKAWTERGGVATITKDFNGHTFWSDTFAPEYWLSVKTPMAADKAEETMIAIAKANGFTDIKLERPQESSGERIPYIGTNTIQNSDPNLPGRETELWFRVQELPHGAQIEIQLEVFPPGAS
jgi:hypothetical protein